MCSIAPTLPESFPSDSATPEECLAINRSNAVERTVLWDAQKLMKDVDFDQNEEEAELVPIGIRMADGGMMEIDQVRRLAEEKGDMRELAEKVGLREIEVADPVAVVSKKNGSGGSKSASAMGQDDNDALRHARAVSRSPSLFVDPFLIRLQTDCHRQRLANARWTINSDRPDHLTTKIDSTSSSPFRRLFSFLLKSTRHRSGPR